METVQKVDTSGFSKVKYYLHSRMLEWTQQLPHRAIPGYNLHHKDNIESYSASDIADMFKPFPYHCDLPKPILPPAPYNRTVLSGEDPSMQLLLTKEILENEINYLSNHYIRHEIPLPKKNEIEYTTTNDKISCNVSGYIAEMANLLDCDPDPYFSGTYNYYYTGGSLKQLLLDDEHVLVFPFNSELVAVPITSEENSIFAPKLKNASKCSIDDTLYELRHFTVNNTSYLLGRFKYKCKFYRVCKTKRKVDLLDIHTRNSSIPLVGADIYHSNSNIFSTLNAEKKISLCDINRQNAIHISNKKVQNKFDNWGSLSYQTTDNNMLIYTNRCCVHYLDTRQPLENRITLCPRNRLEKCEFICLTHESKSENHIYMGTHHSLLLFDKRYQDGVVQKWTHNFRSAPTFIDVHSSNNQEMITLSSQLPNEPTMIINKWISEDKTMSEYLPYRIPSIIKVLSLSNQVGKCLDPSIMRRLKLCLIGCVSLSHENDWYYFTQNSLGDIFYQCLTNEKDADTIVKDYVTFDAWDQWQQSILGPKNLIKPLTFNHKAELSDIYGYLTNKQLEYKSEEYVNLSTPSWKIPLSELATCTDLLAADLLKMWEIPEETVVPVSTAPIQKVLNWLGTSDTNTVAEQSQSQPMFFTQETDPFSMVNTQELKSVSQNIFQESKDIKFEQKPKEPVEKVFLPNVVTKPIRKRKKTNYVAGF